MSREIAVFKEDEVHGVLVIRNGQPQIIQEDDLREVLENLSPSDIFDFVQLQGGASVLVIGDEYLSEEQARKIFGDEMRFLKSQELPAKASSWKLPMAIPAMLQRAVENGRDELDDALRHAGAYLESHTRHKEMSPWQKGLVAASIRTVWKEVKKKGLAEGESHWGWLKHYMLGNGSEVEWEKEKGRLEAYMRAADVMVRNVEGKEWIANLTLSQILNIPITKVVRSCGAIDNDIFDFSYKIQTALLDSTVTTSVMNHKIAELRRHIDEIPAKSVDKETGEIIYTRGGEIVENPDEPVLDKYLPDMKLGVDTSKPKHGSPMWTFDWTRKMFKYLEDGIWTLGLAVVTNDDVVKKFVDRIIAQCGVRADYDEGGGT